jgi:hypothetical protein
MFVLHQILGRPRGQRYGARPFVGMGLVRRWGALTAVVLATSACGQKGALYMPPIPNPAKPNTP